MAVQITNLLNVDFAVPEPISAVLAPRASVQYPNVPYSDVANNARFDAMVLARQISITNMDLPQHGHTSALDEAQLEEAADEASTWAARERVLERMRDMYDESVRRVENELDQQSCWRVVTLPDNIDPTQHEGLGIYWAYDYYAAEAHWGTSGKKVTYSARIDRANIDRFGTITVNSDPSLGDEEKEVRFYSGAPIWVYDVELEDGTVLDINDWRTT